MLQFDQTVSVNFQGLVVVFGRVAGENNSDVYFNVLGLDVEIDDDNLEWAGFEKLTFTEEVRQVGMSIITLKTEASTMVPSSEPFRVITDQQYISIVQQSSRGTLYINRFRLLKEKAGTDQKTTTYSLSPAWEVRYTRSRKEDVPADKSDTQEYLDPEGQPFLEPSLELSMVDAVSGGAFDVVLLPISDSTVFAWQFLTLDADDSKVSLYNFPATDNGLFDLTGKTVSSDFKIEPDSCFSVIDSDGGDPLVMDSAPRAITYVKHEKVVQPDGTSIGVKRATRVMIVLPIKVDDVMAAATIDSAVGTKGVFAELEGNIVASQIEPAEFDLYFDGVSYLQLIPPTAGDNPLDITGPYSMGFMVSPKTLGHNIAIIGGSQDDAPDTAAPYVKIVDGDKIEVGFGNGTEAVNCRTLHPVLIKGVWSKVEITYQGAGSDPFAIKINDSAVPVTSSSTTAEPSGSSVLLIGAAESGFAGALNAVMIKVGDAEAVNLPCDSVDYTTTPPTTSNTAVSGIVATVFGPKQEPSSSPVDKNMSGTFYVDDMGLTYYAGIASFIQPNSATCLTDGSDGLLHLYYQGENNLFSVAQYATTSARATYYTDWTTDWGSSSGNQSSVNLATHPTIHQGRPTNEWSPIAPRVLVTPDNIQTGVLNFVAHRVGTYMNATEIAVTASTVSPVLCNVTLTALGTASTETWIGLPRDINQLTRIWNGAGSDNPDDQGVLDHTKPYFDYKGQTPSVLVPSSNADSGSYFMFTSVPFLPLNVVSVSVADGSSSGLVDIKVTSTAPSNWADTDTLVQNWPNVPADPQPLADAFTGKSTTYDYATVTTDNTRAFGIDAVTARSDDQVSHVLFFVKDSMSEFTVTVKNGSAYNACDVEVCGQVLPEVPRNQNGFAEVINGNSSSYSYPDGYKNDVAKKVYALTDGLSSDVVNTTTAPEPAGAFAYAGLLRVLHLGQQYDAGSIATIEETSAAIIQGATLKFKENLDPITGSMMFGAVVVSPPTDGGIGKICDTTVFSDCKAPVSAPGVNGGWMPRSPKFSLGVNEGGGDNYVSFNIDKTFSPSDRLAILSDMTFETWLNHNRTNANKTSRALTYNVLGNMDNPDLPIQYMMGSKLGPALILGQNTFVASSFNFSPPNLTVQVYVKRPDADATGILLSVSETMGGTEFLSLSVNDYGKPEVGFLSATGVVTGETGLTAGEWICLTVTVVDAGEGNVTLSLFINDGAPVTATVVNSFGGSLGALRVGSQTGGAISASVNGVTFWQRSLSSEQVKNSINHGFPDNDQMLGIRWNFAEGTGTTVMNSAATGPEFDSEVINPANPSWDEVGAFEVPYAGRNDYVIASNRILKGWTHVALACRQGHGLEFNGNNSGKVSDGSPFNPSANFALEAWVVPNSLNSKQIIVEKPGSYSLYIDTLGQVCLTVTITQDGATYDAPPIIFQHNIKAPIEAGKTSYVAVNFTSGTTEDDTGSQSYVAQNFFIKSSLFVNGEQVKVKDKVDYPKPVSIPNIESSFYLGVSGDETFDFEGVISHVRVWGRTLGQNEIGHTFNLHLDPENRDGLIAGWNFDDQTGTVANDMTGNNNLELTSNQMWAIWQDVSQSHIYVDGRGSIAHRVSASDVGNYDDIQFAFGGSMRDAALTLPYSGELDDIRLFSTLLTEQQIREAMTKPLAGSEDNLAAYWMVDAGSGDIVFDMTGMGNNGTMLPTTNLPKWLASSAPIQNEGPAVVNVLGGDVDYLVAQIDGQPSVIEYATSERDAYGNIYSVMKRGYFYYSTAGETVLEVGYKVGDLDTIYVGQVQSKPAVVGYIEGGPPLPSENQTLAYWSGDMGGPARIYSTASSVSYLESDTKTWSFSANQNSTFFGSFNIKGGFYQKSKSAVSVGLGAEAETQMLETKIKLGAKFALSGDLGSTDSVAQSHANTTSLTSSMTPSGTWEPADNILNTSVGRRYIQNNIGIAIVKSAVADMYMMALKGTQTPVGYSMVPNKTIPIDTNIIDFPINPKYIKNGTLDGKVGLMNDPDYPNADAERGSYFKPVEAYALKRGIEKEEQQIKAYYDQFNTNKYRLISSLDKVKEKLGENTAYDFGKKLNQRSIYNNYVWTAGGGLHKEENSVANTYSETYTGASSLKIAGGLEFSADIGTPFGGYYVEADAMLGNTWSMTATKSEATSNAFKLACNIAPTEFLAAPMMSENQGVLQFDGYGENPAPGKVDGYRYMSFLLAPSQANYTALSNVIDQNWLNNSTSAAANAMREAVSAENGPWRVLYRTTYVSRVPPPFQPAKDDTNPPNIVLPANLPSNYWIVEIVSAEIEQPNPTPLEIGTAIDAVLGSPVSGAGILTTLITWWCDFYASAQVYGTTEFKELAELRVDLLEYMVSKYEAQKYLES